MHEYDFISHEKINDRLFCVHENYFRVEFLFNIYVVIGDEKIGVFDTGLGVTGALRRYIEEKITDRKPIVSYMTHVDLDHSGGAMLFDEAYLNSRELPKLEWNLNVERRFSDLAIFCGENREILDFCREHYLKNENVKFRNIDNGDIVSLGGVSFEVIRIFGHTPGSLVFYNREENYVIGGDAIQSLNSYQRCRDPKQSMADLDRFIKIMPENVKIYTGHEKRPLLLNSAYDILAAWQEVTEGKTEGDTKSGMPFTCVDPEELSYDVRKHDCGSIVLLYDANVL
jgi:glyoxylase-like metal-dependent hydrolase (beta-lactamase superfamily II)